MRTTPKVIKKFRGDFEPNPIKSPTTESVMLVDIFVSLYGNQGKKGGKEKNERKKLSQANLFGLVPFFPL